MYMDFNERLQFFAMVLFAIGGFYLNKYTKKKEEDE